MNKRTVSETVFGRKTAGVLLLSGVAGVGVLVADYFAIVSESDNSATAAPVVLPTVLIR